MNSKNLKKHSSVYFDIGKNIKQFRSEKRWTQQDLADKCEGVTRAKISKIENAYQDYMLSTLLEICTALDKSLNEISVENYHHELYTKTKSSR